jgi:hypothetical protein
MPRGIVIPFPSRLTPGDRKGLRHFAALSGAPIDVLGRRNRREIATFVLAGRQLWVERGATGLRAHDASGGHLLAEGTSIGSLLAAVQAALLPGGTAVWQGRTTSAG